MNSTILEQINSLADVKKLSIEQLNILAEEIRKEIIAVTYNNGGHIAPSLGTVDAILALCHTYNFEEDKLIFDVGHQSYCYKLLARGKENFKSVRQEGGESGYPDDKKADSFIGGHAGNSLSASLGIAEGRDKKNQQYNVVTFVGDASFFNGENLEALFGTEKKPNNFIVVFNDNGMSISKNENGTYKFFSKLALKKGYRRTKNFFKRLFGNSFIARGLKKIKFAFKRTLSPVAAIEMIGLKYYGVFDGHNIKTLCSLFEEVKERGKPAFIHIRTKKGKGYEPAEKCAEQYHGVSKGFCSGSNSFSNAISPILCEMVEKDNNVVAITAGMRTGTGLLEFSKRYPDNFYDVGINEEHAVTFAGGLAKAGLKPVVCIYSTFLQRAYDQIMVDICMQKLPVILLLDRAGMVGSDGRTHQGLFDLTYLRSIPQITVLAPKDSDELSAMISYAIKASSPVAIRYPNGDNQPIEGHLTFDDKLKWEVLKDGNDVTVLAVGPRMIKVALSLSEKRKDISIKVVNARTVKPLDEELLDEINSPIVTMEENVVSGGFGEAVASYYSSKDKIVKLKIMGVNNSFVPHASQWRQIELFNLSEKDLENNIENILKKQQ